jgi:hypothetical protein
VRVGRRALAALTCVLAGCAAGVGSYAPPSRVTVQAPSVNEEGVKASGTSYTTEGGWGLGALLGFKLGPAFGRYPGRSQASGFGTEAHIDAIAAGPQGHLAAALSLGYGFEAVSYHDFKYGFGGFSATAVMMYGLSERLGAYGGVGGALGDITLTRDAGDVKASAAALRIVTGVTWGILQSSGADLVFRAELRLTGTGHGTIEGNRVDYQGGAVLGQLMWIVF